MFNYCGKPRWSQNVRCPYLIPGRALTRPGILSKGKGMKDLKTLL